jgi:hypothetical protein
VSERPGGVDAITSVGCDFLLLDHLGGDPGTILRLGTEGTFGRLDSPARPELPGLDQMFAFSPTDIWVINDTTSIQGPEALHYDGAQWHVFPFSNSFLNRMWTSLPSDVWLERHDVTDGHGPGFKHDLQHWNGHAFVTVETPDGVSAGAGAGLAPDDLWICEGSLAYHFDGQRWTRHATGVDSCVAMFATQRQYFLLAARSVSSWDGTAWVPIYSEADATVQLTAMWGAAPDDLWVGGTHQISGTGYLLHLEGTAWSPVAVAGTGIRAIHGTGRDDVLFAAGPSYLPHWDGHAMTDLAGGQNVPQRADWQDLWGSGGTVWAVDSHGTPVTSTGDGWTVSQGCDHCGTRITGSSPTDVWLIPSSGLSLHHFDGSQWSPVSLAPGDLAYVGGAFAASPNHLWVVGPRSTPTALVAAVFHFDGTSWTELAGPPVTDPARVSGVWAAGDDVWVTDGSVLFHRQADQWLQIDTAGVGLLGDRIFGRSSNDVYVAGPQGLVHWNGTALTRILDKTLMSVGGDATRVWVTGRGGYLAIDDGTGFRTLDTGLSGDLVGAYFYAPGNTVARAWVAGNQSSGTSAIVEYRR